MDELSVLINSLIDSAIGLTILLLMFSMGLQSTFAEAFSLLRKPSKLIRYLISVVVLVPIVTFIGLEIIPDVPVEAQVGLLLLSGAAGNALVPKLGEKLGADIKESTSALITLALFSIISAPLVVALAVPPDEISVSGADVANTILNGVVLPVLIGVAIRQWWIKAANLITDPLTKLADSLLSVVVILIILKDLDVILGLGLRTIVVFVGFAIVYKAIGHLIGGPGLLERLQLGMFTSNRNGAIAMLVASSALPEALPAIVAFGVLVLVIDIPYMSLLGRGLMPDETTPAPETEAVA